MRANSTPPKTRNWKLNTRRRRYGRRLKLTASYLDCTLPCAILYKADSRPIKIRRSHHFGGSGRKRAVRGAVEMRPIQLDIVGVVGPIANPDAERGTELWRERLIAPIGRRYRQRRDQRSIFEIAGTRLQEQERAADLEVMRRVRGFACDGLDGCSRGYRIRRRGQGFRILQPPSFGGRRTLLQPRRLGGFEALNARANAAFSFSKASSRAEICSSIVAANAVCEPAEPAKARQDSSTNFLNAIIARTPTKCPINGLHKWHAMKRRKQPSRRSSAA